MRLNRGGSTLGQAQVAGPGIKYTCIEGLKNSPQVEGMGLLEKPSSLLSLILVMTIVCIRLVMYQQQLETPHLCSM
jgi:hypothetical protein